MIYFDSSSTGHHDAYFAAVREAAERRGLSLRRLPAFGIRSRGAIPLYRQLATVRHELRRSAGVIVADWNFSEAALWSVLSVRHGFSVTIIDYTCQLSIADHVGRERVSRRDLLKTWSIRMVFEILVRIGDVRIASILPVTSRRISQRLRRRTQHVGDPRLSVTPDRSASQAIRESLLRGTQSGRSLVVIPGSIRPSKGLDIFVKAMLTSDDLRSRVSVLIAGSALAGYRSEAARLVESIRDMDVPVTWLDQWFDDQTLWDHVNAADVVVLPYRSPRGGSGILAGLDTFRGYVVTTDYGFVGRLAAEAGATTFEDGAPAALADALSGVLNRDVASEPISIPFYLCPDRFEFGARVLDVARRSSASRETSSSENRG